MQLKSQTNTSHIILISTIAFSRCSTSFYAQYKCSGPGAESAVRVPWSYELNDDDAKQFLDLDFIDGASWIHATRKFVDNLPS